MSVQSYSSSYSSSTVNGQTHTSYSESNSPSGSNVTQTNIVNNSTTTQTSGTPTPAQAKTIQDATAYANHLRSHFIKSLSQ